jgi:hypothetical protein
MQEDDRDCGRNNSTEHDRDRNSSKNDAYENQYKLEISEGVQLCTGFQAINSGDASVQTLQNISNQIFSKSVDQRSEKMYDECTRMEDSFSCQKVECKGQMNCDETYEAEWARWRSSQIPQNQCADSTSHNRIFQTSPNDREVI